jgi:hypothetical protein
VQIQKTDFGGKLTIDYFSTDDLEVLLQRIKQEYQNAQMSANPVAEAARLSEATPLAVEVSAPATEIIETPPVTPVFAEASLPEAVFIPEVADEIAEDTIIEPEEDDSDLYSINNFTV